jgi:hypothetical protein
MHITEALEVPVLIVDGLGIGHQNAQTSKTIRCAVVYFRFSSPQVGLNSEDAAWNCFGLFLYSLFNRSRRLIDATKSYRNQLCTALSNVVFLVFVF